MTYLLMDTNTGNSIGSYRTEDAALRAVADTVRRYGADAAESLSLGQYEVGQPGKFIAQGDELVTLATVDSVVQSQSAVEVANATESRATARARATSTATSALVANRSSRSQAKSTAKAKHRS
jgi:hypothetical protein